MTRARFPVRLFVFAFLGWTFDFYDLVLLGFIKEAVAHDLHMTPSMQTWVVSLALGTSGVGGIVSGILADRIGKRTLLAATVLIYSVGSLVTGLAPSATWFFVGRAIVGLGVGGEWAIGHALVAESVLPALRGRSSALLQSGEPTGVAIAGLVGYLLAPRIGWRAVLVGSSVTALLALAARRSMHIPNEKSGRAPELRALLGAGVPTRIFKAYLLGVFKLGTYWTCYTWLPGFLVKQMHQSVAHSVTWILTAQLGQFTGMLTFGVFADRHGRRLAFSLYSLLTAAALVPLAYYWQTLSLHPLAFWSVMLVLGFGSGCTAGFGALLAELFPTEVRAGAMGTTYNLARATQLGAQFVVAYAVVRGGLAGGLSVPLALALLTASWVWVLPETRGIALPALGRSTGQSDAGGDRAGTGA